MIGSTFKGLAHIDELPKVDGAIDLGKLVKLPGGGTHDIYKLGDNPKPSFLLKVIKDSKGNESAELEEKLAALTDKYSELYQVFGEPRCLVEKRCIHEVKEADAPTAKKAIISLVAYDNCFQSEKRFGFNTEAVETQESKILSDPAKYHLMNRFLLGKMEQGESFTEEDFLKFHESFRSIFNRLDIDSSLTPVMKEFLEKFKVYYDQTDQLMDFTGLDNVLFYKEDDTWQYKVGSVIKVETGKMTNRLIAEIDHNPSIVKDSFPNWTHIFFVPSWSRVLNATANKLGMDRIVDNIPLSAKDSQNLSRMHEVLDPNYRAVALADHHQFDKALYFFKQFQTQEKDHDSYGRHALGTKYFRFLEKYPEMATEKEIIEFLNLLTDPKNDFSQFNKEQARLAIVGLAKHLGQFGSLDYSARSRIAFALEKLDKAEKQISMPSSSHAVEQLSKMMRDLEEVIGPKADIVIDQLSEKVPLTFLREHESMSTPLLTSTATGEVQNGQKEKKYTQK